MSVSLFPVSLLANKIFPVNISANAVTANIFPQSITNGIWLWALFNAIVGLILFIVSYRMNGKAGGVTRENWGINTTVKEVFRYLALTLCIYFVFYGVVYISTELFKADYRLWILAIKTSRFGTMMTAWGYAVLFFPF